MHAQVCAAVAALCDEFLVLMVWSNSETM